MTGCLHLPSGRRLLPDACCGYNRPRSRRCPPRSPPYLCVLPCEVRHPGARSLVCPGLTPGRGDARPPWGSVLHDAPESTARRPPTPTDGAARFPDAAHSGQSSFARRRAGFAARAEGYTPPGGPPVGRSELEVETHRRGLEPDVTHRKSQRRKRVRVSPLGDTLVPSRPEPGPLHARMSVPSVTFGRKPRARVCMGGGFSVCSATVWPPVGSFRAGNTERKSKSRTPPPRSSLERSTETETGGVESQRRHKVPICKSSLDFDIEEPKKQSD